MQDRQKRLTEGRLPPYVSYRSWHKLIRELSKHTPSRFDSSYFNALKITKSNCSMLKGSFIFLDLMTLDGYPTPALQQLLKSEGEERREVLAGMVRRAYEPLFAELDLSHATKAQIKEKFKSRGASGDIGRKCLSFFLAISQEADIGLAPHLGKSAPRGRGRKAVPIGDVLGVGKSPAESGENSPWVGILLQKFPNFDPEWTDDLKKKWFDAFKSLKSSLLDTSTSGGKTSRRR